MLAITVTMIYTFSTTSHKWSPRVVSEDGCSSRFNYNSIPSQDLHETDLKEKLTRSISCDTH